MDREENNIERIKRFRLTAKVGNRTFHNGIEYVDLGLPSGTKWATMNVGANSIEDNGLYFQWNHTQGYTKEQIDENLFYSNGYDLLANGQFSKYNSTDKKTILDLNDDAAHVHLGGDWRMPTKEDIEELIVNTNTSECETNGVLGVMFLSRKNRSKRIFIPYAGNATRNETINIGRIGVIWSSSLDTECFFSANILIILHNIIHSWDKARIISYSRISGFSVRGVFK